MSSSKKYLKINNTTVSKINNKFLNTCENESVQSIDVFIPIDEPEIIQNYESIDIWTDDENTDKYEIYVNGILVGVFNKEAFN